MMRQLFLAFLGASAGILVSAGVFTVLLAVGMVPRFAGKTHTGKKIFLYEEMVVLGTLAGGAVSICREPERFGRFLRERLFAGGAAAALWQGASHFLLLLCGFFAGIFVGCLAVAVAEMLDSIPILTRRIGLRRGLGAMVLAIALGKAVGGLLYFVFHFYEAGM